MRDRLGQLCGDLLWWVKDRVESRPAAAARVVARWRAGNVRARVAALVAVAAGAVAAVCAVVIVTSVGAGGVTDPGPAVAQSVGPVQDSGASVGLTVSEAQQQAELSYQARAADCERVVAAMYSRMGKRTYRRSSGRVRQLVADDLLRVSTLCDAGTAAEVDRRFGKWWSAS